MIVAPLSLISQIEVLRTFIPNDTKTKIHLQPHERMITCRCCRWNPTHSIPPKLDIVQRTIFQVHNFRGLACSKILRTQFSRTKDSVSAAIRYSKISRSLIFEVRCQSAKNAKIWRLKHLVLYSITWLY